MDRAEMTAPTTPSPERQPADAGRGLMPCPFCGGSVKASQYAVDDDGHTKWAVGCDCKNAPEDQPYAERYVSAHGFTREEAVAAWNRRTPAPQAQPDARAVEARERVTKYLDRLRKARQNDPEHIHAFDTGEPSEAMLLASDLRALLSAPAADDGWNFNLSEAPEGEQVILATEGGHVGEAIAPVRDDSDDDWFWAGAGFVHKNTPPIAWRPLPAPPVALHPAAPTDEVGKS